MGDEAAQNRVYMHVSLTISFQEHVQIIYLFFNKTAWLGFLGVCGHCHVILINIMQEENVTLM